MLTKRDHRITRFIEAFNCATTKQLHRLFFSNAPSCKCQARMKILWKEKRVNRHREFVSQNFLYFLGKKKPEQIEHDLIRVNAYISLLDLYGEDLQDFKPEYKIADLRADAYFEIWKYNRPVPYFLEVQRNTNFDQAKYETLYASGKWRELWDSFPAVIIVTDKRIRLKPTQLKFIVTGEIKKPLI